MVRQVFQLPPVPNPPIAERGSDEPLPSDSGVCFILLLQGTDISSIGDKA